MPGSEIEPMDTEIAADEGKGSLFYRVHPYPTKVPPSIVERLLDHYTDPGELVLDPFCGSGVTGYAAKRSGRDFYVSDLSPYAAHIARGYTESCSPETIDDALATVFDALADRRELYVTACRSCGGAIEGRYWVWSWVFDCPDCEAMWPLDPDEGRSGSPGTVTCPECETSHSQSEVYTGRDRPLRVAYKCPECHTSAVEHSVAEPERKRLVELNRDRGGNSPYDRPMMTHPDWGDQYRRGNHDHVSSTASLFTGRNWSVLTDLWEAIRAVEPPGAQRALAFAFTASLYTASRLVRCRPNRDGRSNNPGTLYVPPLALEQNAFKVFERRVAKVQKLKADLAEAESQRIITTGGVTSRGEGTVAVRDARNLPFDDGSVDYVVTDPPFGDSLQYAELNFIPESFLDAFTDQTREIVVNETRSVSEEDYLERMGEAFEEVYRVLRPEGYASVIFNNTSPLVWAGTKRELLAAGFELPSVTGIVKGHASRNQTVHAGSTSRFDPVFHALRPRERGERGAIQTLSETESEDRALEIALGVIDDLDDEAEHAGSVAYVHSRVTQRLLEMDAIARPPSPKTLRRLLDEAGRLDALEA